MFLTSVFAEREVSTPYEEKLLNAVKKNDTTSISRLINGNIAVDITDEYGQSLLMFAAESNNKELVKLLIKKGANPNYQRTTNPNLNSRYYSSSLNRRVLDFGVRSKDPEMVDLLIKLGAKLDVNNKDLGSTVANASQSNNVDMVRYLLKKGAKVSNETGQYLIVHHMSKKNDSFNRQKFIDENTDFRIIKIWEDYGISIDTETLTEINLLEKRHIEKYISVYTKWKANGCRDPGYVQKKLPEEIKPDTLSEYDKSINAQITWLDNQIRIQDELEHRKKIASLLILIFIVSITIIFRNQIIGAKFNEFKNKIPVIKQLKRKPVADKTIYRKISSSEKGWTIDDTINIEVNYLTI